MTSVFAVQWTPADGPARKVVFEPERNSWRRTEFELNESQWRQVGTERVETVSLAGDCESAPDLEQDDCDE